MTQTANQREIPILTYHQIAEAPPRGAVFRSLTVSPNRFRSQMYWLKRLGYQGLSMRELMPFLRGERCGRVVGITFDDGYLNNLSSALPVLQELGFGHLLCGQRLDGRLQRVGPCLGCTACAAHDGGASASLV